MGKQQKYVPVQSNSPDEVAEVESTRSFVTTACIWSTIRTVVLLAIYFAPSISLTFYQRWLLQQIHFPLTIVLIHLVVKFTLSAIVRKLLECKQNHSRVTLEWKSYCKAVAMVGFASGIDVGLSNWGLEFITVTLYTLTKSTTIIFILGCAIIFKLEQKSWSLCTIVVMISCGLMLFTYKATQFNIFGFVLLLLASFSSGIRWTCAQLLLQKSKSGIKNPIDMVYHVQPWMIVSILPFAIAFEGQAFISNCKMFRYTDWLLFSDMAMKILLGAFIAFIMECSEFLVVVYTSSLTLSIGGIFKDIFILVLAVEWNGDEMSAINAVGLIICLAGIMSHVIHKLRNPVVVKATNYYEETDTLEMGEPLINSEKSELLLASSDEELSDTQELFNILHSHDR